MTEFHPISISDKDIIVTRLRAENSRSADYNFGNLIMWDSRFRKQIAVVGDRLIIDIRNSSCPRLECPYFVFPVGSGDLKPAIAFMKEYAAQRNCPLSIRGITEEQRTLLESEFPARFEFSETRDLFDYIYLAEKLSTFAGRKLHAKRNFCNRFERTYNWDFIRLTPELVPDCLELFDKWRIDVDMSVDGALDEYNAITAGFKHWDILELEGGVLRIDGQIIGFTVGERTSDDTFIVHFEKALSVHPGAYPMICREFAKQIVHDYPDIVYINREDDMGQENLRKAKLGYYPEYLLKKYLAKEK
ncbi:MAG: DUF2156 domain-containing protein [Lachnospiraceae bacterium]|jgi:hypothetical protein